MKLLKFIRILISTDTASPTPAVFSLAIKQSQGQKQYALRCASLAEGTCACGGVVGREKGGAGTPLVDRTACCAAAESVARPAVSVASLQRQIAAIDAAIDLLRAKSKSQP